MSRGELRCAEFDTPVGVLAVVVAPAEPGDRDCGPDGPVVASGFRSLAAQLAELPPAYADWTTVPAELSEVGTAVADYFAGDVGALDRVAVRQHGGEFVGEVWRALRDVPAGETVSYAELAAAAGRPRAARAAGTACATNAVAPFVPCHRVVRADGSVGEYGYGPGLKQQLLDREAGTR